MSKFFGILLVVTWLYLAIVLTIYVFTGESLLESWSASRVWAFALWPIVAAFIYGMLKTMYGQFIYWLSRQKR